MPDMPVAPETSQLQSPGTCSIAATEGRLLLLLRETGRVLGLVLSNARGRVSGTGSPCLSAALIEAAAARRSVREKISLLRYFAESLFYEAI